MSISQGSCVVGAKRDTVTEQAIHKQGWGSFNWLWICFGISCRVHFKVYANTVITGALMVWAVKQHRLMIIVTSIKTLTLTSSWISSSILATSNRQCHSVFTFRKAKFRQRSLWVRTLTLMLEGRIFRTGCHFFLWKNIKKWHWRLFFTGNRFPFCYSTDLAKSLVDDKLLAKAVVEQGRAVTRGTKRKPNRWLNSQ